MSADSALPVKTTPTPGGLEEVRHARIVAAYLAAGVFVCTNGRDKVAGKTLVEHIIPARKGKNGKGRAEIRLVFEAPRLLGALELSLLLALAGIAFACRDLDGFALVGPDTSDPDLVAIRTALAAPMDDDGESKLRDAQVLAGVTTRAILLKQLAKSNCGANLNMIDEALVALEGLGVRMTDGDGNRQFTRVLSLCYVPGAESKTFRFALDWRMTMAIVSGGSMPDGVQFLQIGLQERRQLAGRTGADEVAQLLHAQLHKLVGRDGRKETLHIDDAVELAYGPFNVAAGADAVACPRKYPGRTRVQTITEDTLRRRRTTVREALRRIDRVCDWVQIEQTGRRGSLVAITGVQRVPEKRRNDHKSQERAEAT